MMMDSGLMNFGHSSLKNSLATLATTLIIQKFQMNSCYYGLFYGLMIALVGYIIENQINISSFNLLSISLLFVFVLIFVVGLLCLFGLKKYFDKCSKSVYINIYDENEINKFRSYMDYNPDYYEKEYNLDVGDSDLIAQYSSLSRLDVSSSNTFILSKMKSSSIDAPLYFDDKYLKIKGYLKWCKSVKQTEKMDSITQKSIQQQFHIKYLELRILKNRSEDKIDVLSIMNKVTDYVRMKNKDSVQLTYIKVMKDSKGELQSHCVIYYDQKRIDFKQRETLYMSTFFHQKKDQLWELIKNIDQNPQLFESIGCAARQNLLFYGPPGTGKSNFIYRMAICLERHIVSLDLRDYTNKLDVYKNIQKPNVVNYDYAASGHGSSIILLEEFDMSVTHLYNKQFKDDDKVISTPATSTTDAKQVLVVPPPNLNPFTLRDLLEIFQGPIPFHGMLIMATTNKYDDIKVMLPELFRAGRLTPVYFGYITKDILQEMCEYYFKQRLIDLYLPEIIRIPTSEIIELVMKSILKQTIEEKFQFFQKELIELIDNIA
ncbi:unnamed protein product [Didymodactylos carnosus]|uniref:ATPase AAA-type core domain-containing protein n=1 Tax=Didymodactylos carnosus TaxID=1234261 RepID=A0A814W447_9BILA|nr:unnamed protein product [Didymodactylos carnosus]CAF1197009.1 unnamed protein product [Didymodactylos carnosus]CAF3528644.1 unnamed protein product [Didymodactylos carnosus]CAF3961368.1 unnamed protein product [Didymodactylos carnosus]